MTRRVAITGFSFRFPCTNISQYWQDLLDGRNLVTKVDPDRWAQESFLHPNKNHPGTSYTFAAGSIGDVSTFDAGFFGISPREAALMDPQQRFLLEMSWEALENSGVKPSTLRGSQCGVFIGVATTDNAYRLADDFTAIDTLTATGNTLSIAANRISYVLDLRGPSMAIDTACSSSMVAFHQACRSILSGESTQALTGGISLHLHPYGFIIFSKASMLSRRG
jgi:phthiocerol/phenolphthiocerol synthesis type-I polyketide synthase C